MTIQVPMGGGGIKSIQRGNLSPPVGGTIDVTTDVTISAVDLSKSVLLDSQGIGHIIPSSGAYSGQVISTRSTVEFVNSTTIRIRTPSMNSAGFTANLSARVEWQVVEYY